MTKRPCSSGKRRHSNLRNAKVGAHTLARELNSEGKIAHTLYAYECSECRGWHLTRQAGWDNGHLAFTAAPDHIQRWAMGQS